jgi:putative phosphoribosyl transferase
MGAIGENGGRVLNDQIIRMARSTPDELAHVEALERIELERRARRYRAGRTRTLLAGRVVVIVDDSIATGSTAKAACQVARAAGAEQVVLAVPVAPHEWTDRLAGAADELISVCNPQRFSAVGQFSRDFTQTSNEEVTDCLDRSAIAHSAVPTRTADTDNGASGRWPCCSTC